MLDDIDKREPQRTECWLIICVISSAHLSTLPTCQPNLAPSNAEHHRLSSTSASPRNLKRKGAKPSLFSVSSAVMCTQCHLYSSGSCLCFKPSEETLHSWRQVWASQHNGQHYYGTGRGCVTVEWIRLEFVAPHQSLCCDPEWMNCSMVASIPVEALGHTQLVQQSPEGLKILRLLAKCLKVLLHLA